MRGLTRYIPLIVLTAALAGCSISAGSSPNSPQAPAKQKPGPLGVLPVPPGATPWTQNTSKPIGLDAFVDSFYIQSSRAWELGRFKTRGFRSAVIEGWINSNGSQQKIAIIQFATANGAVSLFDDLTGSWRDKPKPATLLTDSAVGGEGWVNPTLDSLGNAKVEIAARIGNTVIDVTEFTAGTPDVAAARSLMLKQYDSLKAAA
jgi:hypothetical protein